MRQTLSAIGRPQYPETDVLRDCVKLEQEIKNGCLRIRSAIPHGKRSQIGELIGDVTDGGRYKTAQTVAQLMIRPLSLGAPIERVLEFPYSIIGFLRARYGSTCSASVDELHMSETRLQGELDVLQTLRRADRTSGTRAEMLRLIRELQEALSNLELALEIEEYAPERMAA